MAEYTLAPRPDKYEAKQPGPHFLSPVMLGCHPLGSLERVLAFSDVAKCMTSFYRPGGMKCPPWCLLITVAGLVPLHSFCPPSQQGVAAKGTPPVSLAISGLLVIAGTVKGGTTVRRSRKVKSRCSDFFCPVCQCQACAIGRFMTLGKSPS